jgi:hypothetical protein
MTEIHVYTSMRNFIIIILLLVGESVTAQRSEQLHKDSVSKLPFLANRATVGGYRFSTPLHISKDSLKKGFTLALQDHSFKIVSFLLAYECEFCDIDLIMISGNKVSQENFRGLRHIKAGESLTIDLIRVQGGSKLYRVPGFMIYVTD